MVIMVECMTEKFGLYPEEKMPEIKHGSVNYIN